MTIRTNVLYIPYICFLIEDVPETTETCSQL